jgi:hypothetical protein
MEGTLKKYVLKKEKKTENSPWVKPPVALLSAGTADTTVVADPEENDEETRGNGRSYWTLQVRICGCRYWIQWRIICRRERSPLRKIAISTSPESTPPP